MLAWLTNGTVRGGGITQRTGWTKLCTVQPGTALYQCGYLYEPSFADPHLILSIGGRILQVRVDTDNSVDDLSSAFGLTNPADIAQGLHDAGEQYLVMQAGDLAINNPPTLPLFWDGTTLRRSRGIAASGRFRAFGVYAHNVGGVGDPCGGHFGGGDVERALSGIDRGQRRRGDNPAQRLMRGLFL
jgi:hypothetical protein